MGRRLIINAGVPVRRHITVSDRLLKHPKWLYDLIYSPASTTGSFSSEVMAPSLNRVSKDLKNPAISSKQFAPASSRGHGQRGHFQ